MKNWGVPADWEDGGHGRKLPSLARHPSDVHLRPHVFSCHLVFSSPIGVGLGQSFRRSPDPSAGFAMDVAVHPTVTGMALPWNALDGEGATEPFEDFVPGLGAWPRIVPNIELNGEAFKQGR